MFNPASRYAPDNPFNPAHRYAPDNLFNPGHSRHTPAESAKICLWPQQSIVSLAPERLICQVVTWQVSLEPISLLQVYGITCPLSPLTFL